jgi:hypothetical protein
MWLFKELVAAIAHMGQNLEQKIFSKNNKKAPATNKVLSIKR